MNLEKPDTHKKDTAVRFAPCPTCRKACPSGAKNSWRPFCSERCKMLDLGDWFEERNSIIGKPEDEEF